MELFVLKVILLRYWKGKGMPFLFFGYRNEGAHPPAGRTSVRDNLKHPPCEQKFDFCHFDNWKYFPNKKALPLKGRQTFVLFPAKYCHDDNL